MAANTTAHDHQHDPGRVDMGSFADCPVHDARKIIPEHDKGRTAALPRFVVGDDGVWHIHGYDEARQIIRSELVKQNGFDADLVMKEDNRLLKNPPILYQEGEVHHQMRRETNKYFTPAITQQKHREMMENLADELVGQFKAKKRADLSDMTMEMALKVASRIVGLTNSMLPGVNGRVHGMLNASIGLTEENANPIKIIISQRFMLAFLLFDVKPAIRARRKNPQDDLISYLITREYSDIEILSECVVYGVAGMATTREFISIALWHFLENPALRQRMIVGEQEERYAILHEILRLEPIVGHIWRRTTAPLEFVSEGQTHTIPTGARVDINVYAGNSDTRLTENPLAVCPARPLTSEQGKVLDGALSFGDGYHRCPGAYVAMQESDVLLRKLLAIDGLRIERKPDVSFNPVVQGHEVRNFVLAMD